MPLPSIQLHHCWAKTDPLTGLPALTVRDHCLNVGMVAALLKHHAPDIVRSWLPQGGETLIALHDVGKISPGFQIKAARWNFTEAVTPAVYEQNHAKISQAFLASLPGMCHPNGRPFFWVMAAGGHHGKYPSPNQRTGKIFEGESSWPVELRHQLLDELSGLFGPLPACDIPKGAVLHAFTGFMSFADWIGSDLHWFPLALESVLENRVTPEEARAAASHAVEEIGWHRRESRSGLTFPDLFPQILANPRPLQETLVAAMDRPGLYIVEAPMGEGKTEAALAGAYRRWSTGAERGLYFALPTQLTSERIHDRVEAFLSQVIEDPSVLALVHGNSWLNPGRLRTVLPAGDAEAVSSDLLGWYASGRKAMLAPFGTGTIDQALMSTLPVKHSGLRLFSLAGKVVVIDEVHSYDPYTSALLDRTVKWLLELGGSVIILSATLSSERRASLLAAAGTSEVRPSMAYPLVTKAIPGQPSEAIPVVPDPDRAIAIDLEFSRADSQVPFVQGVEAAEKGACVLIIRNTVGLAQQTYRDIKSYIRDRGIPCGLLHSRFPQFQRKATEKDWMEKLGRDGGERPPGCILVATQVVEQSVDIDADLLLTDLAPVDLVLQRLGRLHRHQRRRPIGYETPRCIILFPEIPNEDEVGAADLKQSLAPSSYVYPPASLLRSRRVLMDWPGHLLHLPVDIRPLVEAGNTYPDGASPAEMELREAFAKETEAMLARAGIQDVFRSPPEDDRDGQKTRWGDKSTAQLILLREPPVRKGHHMILKFLNGRELSFNIGEFSFVLAQELHLNATRIPIHPVRQVKSVQPSWLKLHLSDGIIAWLESDNRRCVFLDDPNTDPYVMEYHSETGVAWSKTQTTSIMFLEPEEDGWF